MHVLIFQFISDTGKKERRCSWPPANRFELRILEINRNAEIRCILDFWQLALLMSVHCNFYQPILCVGICSDTTSPSEYSVFVMGHMPTRGSEALLKRSCTLLCLREMKYDQVDVCTLLKPCWRILSTTLTFVKRQHSFSLRLCVILFRFRVSQVTKFYWIAIPMFSPQMLMRQFSIQFSINQHRSCVVISFEAHFVLQFRCNNTQDTQQTLNRFHSFKHLCFHFSSCFCPLLRADIGYLWIGLEWRERV